MKCFANQYFIYIVFSFVCFKTVLELDFPTKIFRQNDLLKRVSS